MRLQLLLLCFFTAAPFLIPAEISPTSKNSVNSPVKENVVEGSGLPPDSQSTPKSHVMAQDIDWEASGVGPDDEDGDVDDGSAVEGSGREPAVIANVVTSTTLPIATTRQTHVVEEPVEHHIHEISKEDEEKSKSGEASYDTTTTMSSASSEKTTTATTRRPPIFGTQPPRISYDDEDPTAFTNMLKPGILAAITGGTVVGILMAILLVMFIVYRMRKKDEGSYSLDEPGAQHPPHYSYAYQKASTKEFYA